MQKSPRLLSAVCSDIVCSTTVQEFLHDTATAVLTAPH